MSEMKVVYIEEDKAGCPLGCTGMCCNSTCLWTEPKKDTPPMPRLFEGKKLIIASGEDAHVFH